MFRIQAAHGHPPPRPAQRRRQPAGDGRFRTSQDFSVKAYQRLNGDRSRASFSNAVRGLGRVAGRFMRHLLNAMHESRREQAIRVLGRYGHLIDAEGQARLPVSQKLAGAREGNDVSFWSGGFVDQAVYGMRIRFSITGAPCEGDRAHLCVEWGCARKAGLSPISHENA